MLLIYYRVGLINKLLRLGILFSVQLLMLLFRHNMEMILKMEEAGIDHILHRVELDTDEFQRAIPRIFLYILEYSCIVYLVSAGVIVV